ncbi:MAG: phosphoribosylformylglycinamidine cyclo-ligase [Ignavibacteria bacterium]|nr:phosphoribosylformylglycinamidine cyclo-ligase [Ignavibacteria bacterium]
MNSAYKLAGVNLSESDRFVKLIKKLITGRISAEKENIGNFGGFYNIPSGYRNPVLVASADGVGTKILIAQKSGIHHTIGEDLVNHCVNDIAVTGATPLFFLDYVAFGKLKAETGYEILRGIVRACRQNNLALIGGETAEMPGLYRRNEYDLAGTIVGIAEKKNLLGKFRVRKGDVLIGLKSNGLHTNGYSLVRKVLLKKFKLNDYIAELRKTLVEELLRVHKSYLKAVNKAKQTNAVNAMSHITGGGLIDNTLRVIPDKLKMKIDWNAWQRDEIFRLIQKTGKVPEEEMRKVFNLGIGLVMICSKTKADEIQEKLNNIKEKNYIIGEIY